MQRPKIALLILIIALIPISPILAEEEKDSAKKNNTKLSLSMALLDSDSLMNELLPSIEIGVNYHLSRFFYFRCESSFMNVNSEVFKGRQFTVSAIFGLEFPLFATVGIGLMIPNGNLWQVSHGNWYLGRWLNADDREIYTEFNIGMKFRLGKLQYFLAVEFADIHDYDMAYRLGIQSRF